MVRTITEPPVDPARRKTARAKPGSPEPANSKLASPRVAASSPRAASTASPRRAGREDPGNAFAAGASAPRATSPGRPPSPRPAKSAKVVDTLGARIVSGELPPGTLLPTETELARRLRISRPSLREGLRALALKGLVEARTRRGTVVTESGRWNVLDDDVLRWYAAAPPDPAFLMDLLDVRTIFEPAAARIAAARATPEDIVAIEASYRAMAAALPDDVEGCCLHDLAFHERIIRASGNRLLVGFAAAIRTALLAAFRVSGNARRDYENSLSEHHAVAIAIRRRDPAAAEAAMHHLLAGTARDLAPAYAEPSRGNPSSRRPATAGTGPSRRKSSAGTGAPVANKGGTS
ncbi:MAG: FadR/GntR family transcriptional regulator [Casimicrobiaceae bacterium]